MVGAGMIVIQKSAEIRDRTSQKSKCARRRFATVFSIQIFKELSVTSLCKRVYSTTHIRGSHPQVLASVESRATAGLCVEP
jgi:hypothetical protein